MSLRLSCIFVSLLGSLCGRFASLPRSLSSEFASLCLFAALCCFASRSFASPSTFWRRLFISLWYFRISMVICVSLLTCVVLHLFVIIWHLCLVVLQLCSFCISVCLSLSCFASSGLSFCGLSPLYIFYLFYVSCVHFASVVIFVSFS